MARPSKVLVAYDGSPHSKDALRWAMYFKRLLGSSVKAVKIYEPFSYNESRIDIGNAEQECLVKMAESAYARDVKLLEDAKRETGNQGVAIETELITGNAAAAILDCAKKSRAELIIAGGRGHGAFEEVLVGTVPGRLLGLSHVPVLVVKNCRLASTGGVKKILVAYDGSPHSKEALAWAMDIARAAGGAIIAVKVFEPLPLTMMYTMPEAGVAARMAAKMMEIQEDDAKMMVALQEHVRSQGIEISTEMLNGDAAGAVLACAGRHQADLIIAGTRGHGVLEGLLVGSVTRRLVSVSTIPVLVVKD